MARKIVLITGTTLVPREAADHITSRGYMVKRVVQDQFTDDELHNALSDVSGYLIGGYEEPTAEHFERAVRLEAVGWVGTDYKAHVPGWQRAIELGIALLNSPGTNAVSVAEFSILLALTMSRPFIERVALPGAKPSNLCGPGSDLFGHRMGVIGLGRIGSRVARIASLGFGMEVVYYGPRRHESLEQALGVSYLDRDVLISSSDIISMHRPGPVKTGDYALTDRELSTVKLGAVIINTVHNALIDPKALAWAIENRGVRVAQDGIGCGPDWERLLEFGPERFLAVPSMAFNTVDANLRTSLRTARAVCDVLVGRKNVDVNKSEFRQIGDLVVA